ncbi:MAG: hypothetical protein ACLQO7_03600 [Candidatus Bathyarchaeia archaeon]
MTTMTPYVRWNYLTLPLGCKKELREFFFVHLDSPIVALTWTV